uniref:hypothetical protein n=1 Tax=Acetatifactor sp. TaxID=1872090 RepID=UPI004055A0D7
MKRKGIMSVLLIAVMMMTLAGCGSTEKDTVSDSKKTDKTETVESTVDPVEDDQAGVSGPADETPTETVEEPVEEVKANVVTLMTGDGSSVLKEFELPEGYTVVSGDGTNSIEIATDKNAYVRSIQIFSGLNVDIVSAMCGPANPTIGESYDGYVYDENQVESFLEQMGVSPDELIDSTTVTYTRDNKRNNVWVNEYYKYGTTGDGSRLVTQNFSQDETNEVDEYRTFDYYCDGLSKDDNDNIKTFPVNETWTIRITIDEGDRTNIRDTHYGVDAAYASEIIADLTGVTP